MSSPSAQPDARHRLLAAVRTWSGPTLAALGLATIAVLAAVPPARQDPLVRWMWIETLSPARVLPVIGLGVILGLASLRAFVATLLLFGIGVAVGLTAEDRLLWVLDRVPGAATHLFLTGPIFHVAVGAALISGPRLRPFVAAAAAPIAGAMLALTIRLTDPSLHAPAFTVTPLLIALWIAFAIALTLRAFQPRWFAAFSRILGSWLLAIGLLFGATALAPKRTMPPPALPEPQFFPRGDEQRLPP